MIKNVLTSVIAYLSILIPQLSLAAPVILDYVPSYTWYHGCAPTALGSIVGYWDQQGYSNLFDADGWDEIKSTDNVKDQISSPEHNAKYDSKLDNPSLPDPPDTSIADSIHTGEWGLEYGETSLTAQMYHNTDYFLYKGYDFLSENYGYTSGSQGQPIYFFNESLVIQEIDAGRPLLATVNVGIDQILLHSVPIIGYEYIDNIFMYGFFSSSHEDETVDWAEFRLTTQEYYGISGVATFVPMSHPSSPDPVPEPATMLLLGFGLAGFVGSRYRRKKK